MPQPELMAIGDSLFNGVRSLTINPLMAQWSAPSQLARGLGLANFVVPDYPKNVVMNFENWVSKFPIISAIYEDLHSNVDFWNTNPTSTKPQFDNIAIASSTYDDLSNTSPAVVQQRIDAINADIAAGRTTLYDHLADLFFAFNTRFLLNPTGDPAKADLTPLRIVAERKPSRLVVSIGANNGLWDLAFKAETTDDPDDRPFSDADRRQMESFIAALKALPSEIKHIYLNALPLPSCTAVMMPVPDDATDNKPGPGEHYGLYENRFGFNYHQLTGAQVARNDAVVRQWNDDIRNLVAGTNIHIVPLDQTITDYDWKTNGNARTFTAKDGRIISNLMFDDLWALDGERWAGGFMGLDGMHPTFVGYNIMAQTMLETIAAVEGDQVKKGALPSTEEALEADKLISKPPTQWHDIMFAWRDIRRAAALRGPPPTHPLTPHVNDLMNITDFKLD